jgi:hypothetical protein
MRWKEGEEEDGSETAAAAARDEDEDENEDEHVPTAAQYTNLLLWSKRIRWERVRHKPQEQNNNQRDRAANSSNNNQYNTVVIDDRVRRRNFACCLHHYPMIWLWLWNDLGRHNNWPVPLLECQPTNSVEGQKKSTSCGRSAIVKAVIAISSPPAWPWPTLRRRRKLREDEDANDVA